MKTFKIYYKFDGEGETEIQAETKEQAEELFQDGEWERTQEMNKC